MVRTIRAKFSRGVFEPLELGVTQMAAGNIDAAAKSFQDVITANPKTAAAAEAAAHLQDIRK